MLQPIKAHLNLIFKFFGNAGFCGLPDQFAVEYEECQFASKG